MIYTVGQIRTFNWVLGRAEHRAHQSMSPQTLTCPSKACVAKTYDRLNGEHDMIIISTSTH